MLDFDDPVVKFKQDLTYGCSKMLNKDELETLCKADTT